MSRKGRETWGTRGSFVWRDDLVAGEGEASCGVQRVEGGLDFFVDFCFFDSALHDDWSVCWQQVGDFLEGENRFQANGIMLALGVYFADVKLFDANTSTGLKPGSFLGAGRGAGSAALPLRCMRRSSTSARGIVTARFRVVSVPSPRDSGSFLGGLRHPPARFACSGQAQELKSCPCRSWRC